MTRGALRRRLAGPQGIALGGLCLVAALVLAALLAPAILPGSPTAIAKDHALRGPTLGEPFGMDDLGRSVLSVTPRPPGFQGRRGAASAAATARGRAGG